MNNSPVTPLKFRTDNISRRLVLIAGAVMIALALWYVGKWGFANTVSTRAEQPDAADLALDLAPSDPQTNYAVAVLYDRTFLPQDQLRSLQEYERSVALAPNNYLLWLEYGKALSRVGDDDRAESALGFAKSLAPNYSAVKWTLGNTLVRDGKTDEGFREIREAVAADPAYAAPAVTLAYTYFQGDLSQIQNVVGQSAAANATLAVTLAKDHRYDDAVRSWATIPDAETNASISDMRSSLANELLSARKFALAATVMKALNSNAVEKGHLNDGSFEDNIKLDNAPVFEWQISSGNQPQVVQSTRQPHEGAKSLVLLFNSNDGNGLKQLSQTVVVQPNAKYTFRGWYHSDVKSSSALAWQIVDGSTGKPIAELPIKEPSADWREFRIDFNVPADTDGVVIRLAVLPCGSPICPITGSFWIDDLSLSTQ